MVCSGSDICDLLPLNHQLSRLKYICCLIITETTLASHSPKVQLLEVLNYANISTVIAIV
jgi:hypothetical protein